jgi:hypothetical protein
MMLKRKEMIISVLRMGVLELCVRRVHVSEMLLNTELIHQEFLQVKWSFVFSADLYIVH